MSFSKITDTKQEKKLAVIFLGTGTAIGLCIIALLFYPVLALKEIVSTEWIMLAAAVIQCAAVLAGGIIAGKISNDNKIFVICCVAALFFLLLTIIGMLLFNLDSSQLLKNFIGTIIGATCAIVTLKIKKNTSHIKRKKRHYR